MLQEVFNESFLSHWDSPGSLDSTAAAQEGKAVMPLSLCFCWQVVVLVTPAEAVQTMHFFAVDGGNTNSKESKLMRSGIELDYLLLFCLL